MSMHFDVRQLKQTRDALEKLNGRIDDIFKKAINEIAGRMLSSVIKKTPVDTGFLHDSWELGAIVKKGNVYEIEITNSADYAMYVEYGHRIVKDGSTLGWVNGFFMLTTTEANIEKVMDRIVMNIIEKEIGKVW